MNYLNRFIRFLKNKNIHIVGATGAEGSSIVNLLINSGLQQITTHDFIDKNELEKNYKIWHKGLTTISRNKQYRLFLDNLKKTKFHDHESYLVDIEKADIIFVPQSWRLYPQNKKLFKVNKSGIEFYSLTRLYLDFAPAKIIGVTGTVGKGSVANLIYRILERNNKTVYFSGNETWRLQVAEELSNMSSTDYLVLEISHRQIMDGFNRAPYMVIVTNLYPNHLDEMSFEDYCQTKLSLVRKQNSDAIAILNYDNKIIRKHAGEFKSKVVYFSHKNLTVNTKAIQEIFPNLLNIKSNHFIENVLGAATAVMSLDINVGNLPAQIDQIPPLKARLEKIDVINGVAVYNDIKSTTPWATLKAMESLSEDIVVIIGGDTKGISYDSLAERIINQKITTIALKSTLSSLLKAKFPDINIIIKEDLKSAVEEGLKLSGPNGSLLISPAASNFYSYFVKGKYSLRKIISSLK